LELIFICLENPEIAIERVKDRVAKGGHPVDETTIRKRFTKGLNLLDESFHMFDTVYIYLSKYKIIEGILVLEPQVKKATTINAIPSALESQLPHLKRFVQEASQ
jgi:predicted ABC-type ATPase